MFTFSTEIKQKLKVDPNHVMVQASRLADDLGRLMTGRVQTTLLQYGKKATGATLASVGWNVIQQSLYRQRRTVTAGAAYRNIVTGRRRGMKMPVTVIGEGPRGGKIFAPTPTMLAWFLIKGVDRNLWWPIMRSISVNGIRPLNVPNIALGGARVTIDMYCRTAGIRIANGIIRVA